MRIKEMITIGLSAAIICVLAPIAIPLASYVPISLATLSVMLCSVLFNKKIGIFATTIYIIIGAIGLPVFSNYHGGLGVLLSMTGGYIIGYIPLAFISGYFSELSENKKGIKEYLYLCIGMLLGTIVLYVIGTIWFELIMKLPLWSALMACVIPFIPGDILKILIVCLLYNRLKNITKTHTV